MNAKRLFVCAFLLTGIIALKGFAMEEKAPANTDKQRGDGFSLGTGLTDAAGEFGFQGNVTSPWFLWNKAAVRGSGFILYRESNWTPYYGFRLGLIGGTIMANADIRLYGEGGVQCIFPDESFDSDVFVIGGYGHFGFEFFVDRAHNGLTYYIELGSNGISATADSEAGSPLYMNGFATTVGLRFYP